jgi:hypothetical protein
MKLLDDEPGGSPSVRAEVIWLKLLLQSHFRPNPFRSEDGGIMFLRKVCNILQYYMFLKTHAVTITNVYLSFFTEECSGKKLQKLRRCSRKFGAAYESSRNDPKILFSNCEFQSSP